MQWRRFIACRFHILVKRNTRHKGELLYRKTKKRGKFIPNMALPKQMRKTGFSVHTQRCIHHQNPNGQSWDINKLKTSSPRPSADSEADASSAGKANRREGTNGRPRISGPIKMRKNKGFHGCWTVRIDHIFRNYFM